MEEFYNPMTEYINSKKPKKICYHTRVYEKYGYKWCLDCSLRLHRVFCDDLYSDHHVANPKEDRFPKIRQIMIEMMCAIIRKGGIGIWGEECYYEPPEAGLPRELGDHMRELCLTCMDIEKKVKCHRRSLCAALLWKKVKSLYPSSMKLAEFSKRVGVSVPTITNTRKKLI